ncbi:MAG: pyruvate dehydrogenase complex dihydrolipoamide acetyltransferase [Rhodospirillales bacterium]|nr:pyruvate dehydrogenase complex dihydrolipoamide acetyltransferase [Rhodospirillales bacterium]
MPIEVLMPALSPTMTEGNLVKWHKKEGDSVASGDVLAEIETDKATMEVEAVEEGTLGKIVVPEGTEAVKVNEVIALILEEGEDKSSLAGAGKPAAKPAPAAAPPAEAKAAPQPAAPQPQPQAAKPAAPAPQPASNGHASGERVFASPLARRLAEQQGLDLGQIKGSGPQGRIVKADIEAAKGQPQAAKAAPAAAVPQAAAAPRPAPAPVAAGASKEQIVALAGNPPYTEVPHTAMRRVIARRLAESKQTVPHFYLTVDCEIDALLKIRGEVNAKLEGGKVSVNDFVIRAVALALRKVPAANASWSDEAILRWNSIDIAVAVAIDAGLITPIVKNADQKGLAVIAAEMKDLAGRAKEGKLKLEEFQGGTISISNLGMFGIKDFAAVINPPQGCIIAVGAGEQRPVVKNGALAIATMMSLTLSADHRVVDGAVGAQFISEVKKLLEDPLLMLL